MKALLKKQNVVTSAMKSLSTPEAKQEYMNTIRNNALTSLGKAVRDMTPEDKSNILVGVCGELINSTSWKNRQKEAFQSGGNVSDHMLNVLSKKVVEDIGTY